MPVFFISHGGGPWPWVDGMRQQFAATERELAALPARLPAKPKAVLVISGHWEAPEFTVSTAAHPPMVYDYSGFPEHTYHISYPAPGSAQLSARVRQLLTDNGMTVREDAQRGFDHGTFVPLVLMYPDADVPVVTLSLAQGYDPVKHLRLGQALRPLRDEGVLIIGSGMTYHNMSGFGRAGSAEVADRFLDYLNSAVMAADWKVRNEKLTHWERAPGARQAHPREDHLIPLMVVAGAAGEDAGRQAFVDRVFQVPTASYEFGGRQ